MTERRDTVAGLTAAGRVFLGSVIFLGLAAIGFSVYELHSEPLGYQWFMLAALTLVSGSATVKLPSVPASISVSETFVFASVLLLGPAAGTLTVALDGLVISFWMAKRRPEWYRALFNMTAPALSIWCASQLLFSVGKIHPLIHQAIPANTLLIPLIVFALIYFALNSSLIALAVAFETGMPPYRIWRENFLWLSLNYFSGASVALLLVVYTRDVDLRFIGVIVPLLLVLYFTFKTSMGRVEDANSHLQQLNRLYLSTIETLAMAIDAKDQITHGHIRRVQTVAVALAGRVGVTDDQLLKAIEAAALLHDMGKLAVPEYILNKPGKLSVAEFEKMKLHATVGADILTAIEFPYPVVPIVRHHHENWDGTGYPAGLKGTEIPIGARILSVVDCFDALTSDRPYRPRLSQGEALKILMERRGNMYDPLIVDTFIRVRDEIVPESPHLTAPRPALCETGADATQSTTIPQEPSHLDEITASAGEMLTLYELARALGGQASVKDTGDIIGKHVRRLIPCSLCVFYSYDSSVDELEAKHTMGEGASAVKALRIALGQRLSGWVAANRQTIVNSDPSLDLGEVARSLSPRLRSCLSAPLLAGDDLVGVIALYSSASEAFTEDHRRILEMVSKQIALSFKRAAEFDNAIRHDNLAGLPSLAQLEQFVEAAGIDSGASESPFALLFIGVVGLKQINSTYGRNVGDDALRHVVRQTRTGLRGTDILFRYGGDEFVVLLNNTDGATVTTVADRICERVQSNRLSLRTHQSLSIEIVCSVVSAPHDGKSLGDLIARAKMRLPNRHISDTSTVH